MAKIPKEPNIVENNILSVMGLFRTSDFPLKDFPNACIMLDEGHYVIGMNPAAEHLLKLKKNDILGKPLADVLSAQEVYLSPDVKPREDDPENHASVIDQASGLLADVKVSSLRELSGKSLGRIAVLRSLPLSSQQEALRNRNEILMALQETTFDLHSSLDLEIVLQNIVKRACKLLETPHGYLVILRESGEMEPVVGFGALESILNTKITLGKGLAGIVWRTGQPLFVPDYERWAGRLHIFPPGQVRSILGMPLILNEQVVGVIGIARGLESENSFSEEDIAVLRRFADLAVLAFQNARLFKQAQAEIQFRRKTEIELRNANQVLQFQIERVELLQKELQEQAVRDALTNLFNRRYLEETLGVEFARAERSRTSLAIMMIDCDHLKEINDTYGHKAGDDSLVRIANVIRESIRAGDIACRYGGDEFVVVLSNVSQETAVERAEILRNRITTEPVFYIKEKASISVSIGIAMFPTHGTLRETVLQKADKALYEAKAMGKNQVMMYAD